MWRRSLTPPIAQLAVALRRRSSANSSRAVPDLRLRSRAAAAGRDRRRAAASGGSCALPPSLNTSSRPERAVQLGAGAALDLGRAAAPAGVDGDVLLAVDM